MEMLQIAGFSVLAAFMALSIRKLNADMSLILALAAGVILLGIAVLKLTGIVSVLHSLASAAGLNSAYLQTLLKVIGIATLAQFAAQTCRDAGEEGLALKVEFTSKAILLSLLAPIVVSIVRVILELVP